VRIRSAAALALSVAVAAGAAPPSAAAHAAALDTDYPCYADGENVLLAGSGFTPGGSVALSVGGQQLTTVGADPEGGFTVRVEAPIALLGVTRLRFTATDRARLSTRASTVVRIAATDVLVTPAGGSPSLPRRIRAWGFIESGAVYAHVKRRGHRRARNIRLGAPRGACGVLDVERRLFRRLARPGVYTLQFDAFRRYIPNLAPSVRYFVAVLRPILSATPRSPAPALRFSLASRVTRAP
jgi:uncharacterized membrane protein